MEMTSHMCLANSTVSSRCLMCLLTMHHVQLQAAPKKSVVMLQMCAHNPTGMDLSLDQWKQVAAVIKVTSCI